MSFYNDVKKKKPTFPIDFSKDAKSSPCIVSNITYYCCYCIILIRRCL